MFIDYFFILPRVMKKCKGVIIEYVEKCNGPTIMYSEKFKFTSNSKEFVAINDIYTRKKTNNIGATVNVEYIPGLEEFANIHSLTRKITILVFFILTFTGINAVINKFGLSLLGTLVFIIVGLVLFKGIIKRRKQVSV